MEAEPAVEEEEAVMRQLEEEAGDVLEAVGVELLATEAEQRELVSE